MTNNASTSQKCLSKAGPPLLQDIVSVSTNIVLYHQPLNVDRNQTVMSAVYF